MESRSSTSMERAVILLKIYFRCMRPRNLDSTKLGLLEMTRCDAMGLLLSLHAQIGHFPEPNFRRFEIMAAFGVRIRAANSRNAQDAGLSDVYISPR